MRSARLIALLFALFAITATGAHAQAVSTASKNADVSAFGTYQFVRPDFGQGTNLGGSIGVNFTRYFARLPVAPSVEVRGNYTTGNAVTQRSLVGGLRVQKDYGRFHPYLDFLGGGGTVKFSSTLAPTYTSDRGVFLEYGGGVDIDLIRHFQLKVDMQAQHYNLGAKSSSNPSNGTFDLSPVGFGIGLAYRIPFRPHLQTARH